MKSIKELDILSTDAYQQASYWNNNGAYQKEYNALYEKMVPAEGAADTLHGELIRGISRLFYEYCNNGNWNAVEVTTARDHEYDFRDTYCDDENIDWDEVEDVTVDGDYAKFLILIQNSLSDTIDPDEVRGLVNGVWGVIEDAGYRDMRMGEYFREENVNKYNALCDAVIWYVLNTDDRSLPSNYERS